jgi:hypothetical protein
MQYPDDTCLLSFCNDYLYETEGWLRINRATVIQIRILLHYSGYPCDFLSSSSQGEQTYIRSGCKLLYVLESCMIVSDQTKYRTENRSLGSCYTNLVTSFNKIP